MGNSIVIIGAGGHGKVVCDAILAQNKFNICGFVDSSIPKDSVVINNYKVIAHPDDIASLKSHVDFFVVAIGNNKIREKLFYQLKEVLKVATIIHPSAIIGSEVKIGAGTVVLANTVINTSAEIGENVIVNSMVVIDHDCKIGNHIHLSIGTMVGSSSSISNGYLSAIGENINSFSKI
jgi:sugar O-acyltransferase (sialic acid O-acetyltransferase NeuD family)